MKLSFLIPACVLAIAIFPQLLLAQSSGYTVTERGADYNVLQKTTIENGTNRVHRYTALATGMNYTNAYGQLVESKEQITILPNGGAVANQGRHTVSFPADIYNGVLEVVTPDGRHLQSRPLAVSYDDVSNTVFIATLTNAVGWLTASNQVTYRNCFDGIKADLVCTYRRGGFECDLVFREQPPAPDAFGLDASFTTLQLITEFFDTQDPQQIPAASDEWFGLQDETLKFGKMTMKQGKAFAIGTVNSQSSAAVYKSWLHLDSRTFLVEQVPLVYVADDLDALPLTSSIQKPATGSRMFASNHRQIPPAHGVLQCTNQILIASADFNKQPGVVLDYNEVNSGQSDLTFESGQTYLIGGDDFALGGQTVFEGGAVIKINAVGWNSGVYPCVDIYDTAVFPPSADNPAIFTSMNDDSVGEVIDGSTGSPDYLDSEYSFMLERDMTVSNMCFNYAIYAIDTPYNIDLWNCEFAHVDAAVTGSSSVGLHNVLICHGTTNFEDTISGDGAIICEGLVTAENVTLDDFPSGFLEGGAVVYLTNCLFTSGSMVSTNGSTWSNAGGPVYQAGNAVGYYLATSSPYRNIGTTNIDPDLLVALRTMTTYAPQDGGWPDTNAPDLGYHYPVNEDSDHDGLADWWEWYWFGNYTHSGSELDANGNTLLSDYQSYLYGSPLDPNPIVFTISVANNYVSTSYPTLQLSVTAGTPYYYTVQMDNTNFETATNWTAYTSSTITANLGATEGWHELWVGLKGLPDAAQRTWRWKRLKLDLTPPQLVITSPTNGTVDMPMIQLTGYSPEALGSYSYDLSNAVAVVTNRQVLILNQYHDATTWEFTTNTFQAFDIPLTNGLNQITLHATDLAGNATTLVTNFTVSYSNAANPVVSLTWPTNGMELCGSSFILRGTVDDPMAIVIATITDTNGNTSAVGGGVERNGRFWVENLPLAEGTNTLTLWVTNSAGLSSATNILLVKSDMTLALTWISGDLWQPMVNVGGLISDPAYAVWVNGVKGTNYGNGTWSAGNVPVTDGGVASFDVSAINGGDPNMNTNVDKPAELYVKSYTLGENDTYHWYFQAINPHTYPGEWLDDVVANSRSVGWEIGLPGDKHWFSHEEQTMSPPWWCFTNDMWVNYYWPTSLYPEQPGVAMDSDDWIGYTNYNMTMGAPVVLEHCKLTVNHAWTDYWPGFFDDADNTIINNTFTGQRTADAVIRLRTGGKALSARQNLFCLHAAATTYKDDGMSFPWESGATAVPIPATSITINGQFLGSDGNLWLALEDNLDIDVTPQVNNEDYYEFDEPTPPKYPLQVIANSVPLDPDEVVPGADFCVGQYLTFALSLPDGVGSTDYHWTLGGNFYNADTNPCSTCSTDPFINPSLLTSNETTAWWVSGYYNPPDIDPAFVDCTLVFYNGQAPLQINTSGLFHMYRPNADVSVATGTVAINYNYPFFALHDGTPSDYWGGTPGITFSNLSQIPQAFEGDFKWVQVINYGLFRYQTNDQSGNWFKAPETNSLDGSEPYLGATSVRAEDSPGISIDGYPDSYHAKRMNAFGDLSMWLEFQPPEGHWVPINLVNWQWRGDGILDSTGTNWNLSNPSNPVLSNDATEDYPTWKLIHQLNQAPAWVPEQ